MASSADSRGIGMAERGERSPRSQAAWAIRLAAKALGVHPTELRAAAYRGFRSGSEEAGLPSALAISVLFRGWRRACEYVAVDARDEVAVEAQILSTLYGDPSGRHRAPAPKHALDELVEISPQSSETAP